MGNYVIVRGVFEVNIVVFVVYFGMLSLEFIDMMVVVVKKVGVYMEYLINEKVVFEMVLVVVWSGFRVMMVMKYVGFNVVVDSFFSLVGMGVEGGFVIMVVDDLSMWFL